jgi:nucleolar GTP-binding protein
MERLTFASMQHLPTAVLFVIDPTGLSGDQSTLRAQLNVRAHLKSRFPRRPWLDIVSKADVPLSAEVTALLPEGHLRVSVHEGTNMQRLRDRLDGMFGTLQAVMAAREERSKEVIAGGMGDKDGEGVVRSEREAPLC